MQVAPMVEHLHAGYLSEVTPKGWHSGDGLKKKYMDMSLLRQQKYSASSKAGWGRTWESSRWFVYSCTTAAKIWWGGEQWECCWNRYPKIWKWELSSLTTMCMWDNSIYWSEVTISLLLVIDRLTLFCFCFCWHKRDSDNPRYISTSINISV